MDRNTRRYGRPAIVLLLALVLASASGCSMLATVAYLVRGTSVPADYDGLKGKKVVVVCRPVATLTWGASTSADELARQVGTLLRANVSKIRVVDHQKVAEWTDEHDWIDYPEVGKALKADVVVGIDLADFKLYCGQTLYQGSAQVSVTVYDCREGDKEIYQKDLPQVLWPPNGAIAGSEMPEPQFRRRFILELADAIGRHFYPHDKQRDFARDSDAM